MVRMDHPISGNATVTVGARIRAPIE